MYGLVSVEIFRSGADDTHLLRHHGAWHRCRPPCARLPAGYKMVDGLHYVRRRHLATDHIYH